MALERKYQGREQSKSRDEAIYRETWYGEESEIDTYISTLVIGTYVSGKGYLHEWEKKQETPHMWTVEVTYRITYESIDDGEDDPSSSSSSAKQYSLSVRNIQIPLESHPLYKACWNHYLLCLGSNTLPAWWNTATTTLLPPAYRKFYMWVSSISEIPLEPNESGKYWYIVSQPTKPGVQVYDRACFVVTEKSKYKTSSAAGAAISKNINEIHTPPHTFGITGGMWKLDSGSVEHDGKRWVATQEWTRADVWDQDLYGDNSSSAPNPSN